MIPAKGYAAYRAREALKPFEFERREPRPNDVAIEIHFCGICHSDIHTAREEWGPGTFPVVPGHEIVGRVTAVGTTVNKFRPGDIVGVGCFVDSCRKCLSCTEGLEQLCETKISFTYGSTEQDGVTPTYGGYSNKIVVDENYVLRIPTNLDFARAAPLLCAGITTYSPLKQHNIQRGQRIGVVGLGGLGHMAVKLGAAFGCEVTVISTSPRKEADARKLGAARFLLSSDSAAMERATRSLDFIIDTVAADHDISALFGLLKRDKTLVLVGAPSEPLQVRAMPLIRNRIRMAGSLIGGIRETQEMLDFCGKHNVLSDIELIPPSKINEAYDRTVKGDVRYRFVLDMSKL